MTNSNNKFGVFKTVTIDHSDTPPDLHSTVRRSLAEESLLDCKVTGRSLATMKC